MKKNIEYSKYAFVIPAYNPDEMLIKVISDIKKHSDSLIFVINDGSKTETTGIFREIEEENNIILLEHYINQGKGAALKTAFNHILTKYPDIQGVVTLDSDGQHSITDCLKVLNELENNENAFVLGYRTFSKEIPLKSYVGNNISRFIYKLVLGRTFKDTQTGLRGISKNQMIKFLSIKSNRFEYETEQLIIASDQTNGVNIVEVPIQTIYINNNRATSFKPLTDSFKIYFVLLRYFLSSVLTALVDMIIYLIAISFGFSILSSNIFARTVALVVQFTLLREFVFKDKSAKLRTFILFSLYVYVMGVISSLLQISLVDDFAMNSIFAKILVESILFILNFSFLRSFLFNKKLAPKVANK